jgi:hypothetical protein
MYVACVCGEKISEAHVLQHALAQWCHGEDSFDGGRRSIAVRRANEYA